MDFLRKKISTKWGQLALLGVGFFLAKLMASFF
jgi:hypothetical protein